MHFDIRQLETTASTNDDVKLAAEQAMPEGYVVWALSQSAGRGRQGRQWQSPVGNLYCSVLLRPKSNLRDYGHYSFVAALAIRDTVHDILPDAVVELKWPNDVLVDSKKISGILLESGEGYLVVGMGMNVQHVPENPLYPVTSLAAEGADISIENVLNKLLDALSHWYDMIEKIGFSAIRNAWITHARKGAMHIRMPHEDIHGHFVDLDEQGNLKLLLADGTERRIITGDVFFR